MAEAVKKVLHPSARTPDAIIAFKKEAKEKYARNQYKLI